MKVGLVVVVGDDVYYCYLYCDVECDLVEDY